jgi:hypothetical protein
MADEEGMSDRIAASIDGSGVWSFLYTINGIFLVGERVRDRSNTLKIIWVTKCTKSKKKVQCRQR